MEEKYIVLVFRENGQLYPKYAERDENDPLQRNLSISEDSGLWLFTSGALKLSAKIGERANTHLVQEDAIIGVFKVPISYTPETLNTLAAQARSPFV